MIYEKVKEIEEMNVRLVAQVIGLQSQLLNETGDLNKTIEDLKLVIHNERKTTRAYDQGSRSQIFKLKQEIKQLKHKHRQEIESLRRMV